MNVEGIPLVNPDLYSETYYDEPDKYNVTHIDIYSRPGNAINPFYRTIFVLLLRAGLLLIQLASIPIKDTNLILLHNVIEFATASIAYGVVGYIVAYGKDSQQFIGTATWIGSENADTINAVTGWAAVVTATGIFTTMVAGRIHLVGLVVVVFIMAAVMDPIMIHWIWTKNGIMHRNELNGLVVSYKDIGGCMIVHIFAGTIALLAVWILGRRLMRLRDINESSLPPSAPATCFLGYFLLMIGLLDICMPNIFIDTQTPYNTIGRILMDNIMAVAGGMLVVIFVQFATDDNIHYWTMLRCLQGGIAGLVIVSAGIDEYTPAVALLLGMAGGVIYYFVAKWLFQTQLEDYCNIIPIHLLCGLIGSLLPPLFGNNKGSAFNKESQVSEIMANISWQGICDCILLIMFLLFFLLVFLLLRCTGFLRNQSDDVEHRRALVVQNRRDNISYMKRLFKPDDPPLLIKPGNESKNINWDEPKLRENYFNPQFLDGPNARSDYIEKQQPSGVVQRNPTFQAYRVEVVTNRPPLEGYNMDLASKSAENRKVEIQKESGSRKELVDTSISGEMAALNSLTGPYTSRLQSITNRPPLEGCYGDFVSQFARKSGVEAQEKSGFIKKLINMSNFRQMVALNFHTGPFGELIGSRTQVEQCQKQGDGEQLGNECFNSECRRRQRTKTKYGMKYLSDFHVRFRTQNGQANSYRLSDNNNTVYNKRIKKAKNLIAISESNNIQMENGIQQNEKPIEQNFRFGENTKTSFGCKIDTTQSANTLTLNGNSNIGHEHSSNRATNKPIFEDDKKSDKQNNLVIYDNTVEKIKSSRLELASVVNTQAQPYECNPNVDGRIRSFNGNIKKGSKSWFSFKRNENALDDSFSLKIDNEESNAILPVRALSSHDTGVKKESRMKSSRGLRKISLRVESVKRMWRKAHRLNKRRNTKNTEHALRDSSSDGAVRRSGSDSQNTADEQRTPGSRSPTSRTSQSSTGESGSVETYSSESGKSGVSEPSLSQSSSEQGFANRSMATISEHSEECEEKSGESDAALSRNPLGEHEEDNDNEACIEYSQDPNSVETFSQDSIKESDAKVLPKYSSNDVSMRYSQDHLIDSNTTLASEYVSEIASKENLSNISRSEESTTNSQQQDILYTASLPRFYMGVLPDHNMMYKDTRSDIESTFSQDNISEHNPKLTPRYINEEPSKDMIYKDTRPNEGVGLSQEFPIRNHTRVSPKLSNSRTSEELVYIEQRYNEDQENVVTSEESDDYIGFSHKFRSRNSSALTPRYSSEYTSKNTMYDDQKYNEGLAFSQEYINRSHSVLNPRYNNESPLKDAIYKDQTSNDTFSEESKNRHHPALTPRDSSDCPSKEMMNKYTRFGEEIGLFREYICERHARVVPRGCSERTSEEVICKDSRSDVEATSSQDHNKEKH